MAISWVWYNVQYKQGPNNSVKILQGALNNQLGTKLLVDGVYGDATKNAYQKWQEKLFGKGPDSDGLVAPTSLAALAKAEGFIIRKAGEPDPNAAPKPTTGRISPRDVLYTRFVGTFNLEATVRSACAANGFKYSTAWLNGYRTALGRESGGDPNAVNLWDSNAVNPPGYSSVRDYGNRGTFGPPLNGSYVPIQCSRGPWQTIFTTFAYYHAPGTSLSIYDPTASCASSQAYVVDNYGVATDGSNLARLVQQFDPSRPPKGY